MISFDQALEQIRSVTTPLGTEMLPLARAAGRVLAAPVVAMLDSPRANVSAMDGYAVRAADLASGPVSLTVVGQSLAGANSGATVAPGAAARIFTGAAVPDGADQVIIQEDVRREGDVVLIDQRPAAATHIRARGSDFAAGEILLQSGRRLDPRAIVAAAAADVAEVLLHRQPQLTIVSTGDELTEPGDARSSPAAIPDSVALGVAALAAQWGAGEIVTARLRDNLPELERAAAAAAATADLIVVTGGASVGERDYAKAMFAPLGLEMLFATVAIKPGKPVWLGRAGATLILGLPGNPTSALVTARLLLAPLLAGLNGQRIEAALAWRMVPLAAPLPACGTRETFHRARLVAGEAAILPDQNSGAQKALAEADVLVRQRADATALAARGMVEMLDF
ncbi:MAG: molybdopterin molybdotransferase MoeA [Sphingomicrobium sp.]